MIGYTWFFKITDDKEIPEMMLDLLDNINAGDEKPWNLDISYYSNKNGQFYIKNGIELFFYDES